MIRGFVRAGWARPLLLAIVGVGGAALSAACQNAPLTMPTVPGGSATVSPSPVARSAGASPVVAVSPSPVAAVDPTRPPAPPPPPSPVVLTTPSPPVVVSATGTPVFAAASPSPVARVGAATSPVTAPGASASPPAPPVSVVPAGGGERVGGRELGLTLVPPAGWTRLGGELTWSDATSPARRVGVDWTDMTPGWQPTALLPNHSRVVRTTPVEFGWGKGIRYTLERTGTAASGGAVESIETHVIVQVGGKRAYDFFAVGRTDQELIAVEPALQRLLSTVALAGG